MVYTCGRCGAIFATKQAYGGHRRPGGLTCNIKTKALEQNGNNNGIFHVNNDESEAHGNHSSEPPAGWSNHSSPKGLFVEGYKHPCSA